MYSKKLYKLTKVGDIKWEKYLSGQMFLKIEAKQSETFEAKQSETKRKIYFLFSQKEAKRKRNCFCFAWFRFEANKIRSENGTP